ncbi:GGDEF domain-containing protein [Rheinheimera sp. UJ51]|uniref:GGDEF domain-containing protein n=1 Tax=Rheinheimera sp. UJ51 TaxID=2892446 RepID=UPI001E35B184|nr:GGDEF domain-containing protein [Rheinheimera sp. UJ51]MCC5452737.1 GGDEF domain-containing protein [Rheinheimera sp. UJ51]
MTFINDLFNGSFMPHGHCLLWRTDLLILHVGGDLMTFVAYMLIPLALLRLVKMRDDLKFSWIVLMFACFIFFCGATHFLGVVNVWHGYYYIHGIMKSLTGIVSIATAIMLWHLLPYAIAMPSKRNLEEKIVALTLAEKKLAQANQHLESEVAKRTAQLEKLATTDELTELANRREIMRILDIELLRCLRQKSSLCIMMLDLDHFKAINDDHGHQTGDQTLKFAAECFKQQIRKIDFIGRIGGEEFLIILPDTAIDPAVELAERIRLALNQQSTKQALPNCTVSIGVTYCQITDTPQSLLQRADDMMYQAKTNGRDQVCFS